jgi:hypothetical protein
MFTTKNTKKFIDAWVGKFIAKQGVLLWNIRKEQETGLKQ